MQRIELKEIINSNESISDSLCKAIEYYDENAKKQPIKESFFASISSFWQEKQKNYIDQLREIHHKGGFLEGDWMLLNALKEIHNKYNAGNDVLAKQVFDYLEKRIAYLEKKERRTPYELTENYKILLIGDGWVQRTHKNNPVIKNISNFDKEKDKEAIEDLKSYLDLKNRLYNPDQVYTIDHNPAQLPDLCGDIENVKSGELPDRFFDFVYFEGMGPENDEKSKMAVEIALSSLKDEGLLIYHTPKPNSEVILIAKKNEITQDKLNKIPDCIKKSVGREYYLDPLERVVSSNSNQVSLVRKGQENIYEQKRIGKQM